MVREVRMAVAVVRTLGVVGIGENLQRRGDRVRARFSAGFHHRSLLVGEIVPRDGLDSWHWALLSRRLLPTLRQDGGAEQGDVLDVVQIEDPQVRTRGAERAVLRQLFGDFRGEADEIGRGVLRR